MSKEIQCKCCKEYWWEMNIHSKSGLCPNCYDYVADIESKLAESEDCKNMLYKCITEKDIEIETKKEEIAELQKQLEEKERLLQYGKTEIKKLNKRITDIIERDKKLLKSQPAEIVEKIKKRLCDRLNIIAGYGQMTIDEFSFFVESEFTKDIDDVLKEYQKQKEKI